MKKLTKAQQQALSARVGTRVYVVGEECKGTVTGVDLNGPWLLVHLDPDPADVSYNCAPEQCNPLLRLSGTATVVDVPRSDGSLPHDRGEYCQCVDCR